MKTLTLRNIPDDVQKIIDEAMIDKRDIWTTIIDPRKVYTKTIYSLIRAYGKMIAESAGKK